ncbi:unnamed protein product [Amoebophrya sp. A25]|nr:unnamed protein product [Amoebophrya sp. A25]|eukprot:GSA25T00023452001.1
MMILRTKIDRKVIVNAAGPQRPVSSPSSPSKQNSELPRRRFLFENSLRIRKMLMVNRAQSTTTLSDFPFASAE